MIEDGTGRSDETFMDRALELARDGWGQVSPNPLVGAVVVSGGRVIGEGFHVRYGSEHAEVVALRQAGEGTAGATLYVSLEPCDHHGKTPACTEAIRRARISRVVYGCRDPDGRAAGGGEVLRKAGLEVVGGVRSTAAARLNGPFIWDRLGLGPWVSLKLGLSLDGRIAARPGTRTDLTGRETEVYVHQLRAGHDAIMVGGRTAVIDDPLLTVRLAPSPRLSPTRVVLDPGLEISADSRLVESVEEAPLVIFCAGDAPVDRRRRIEKRGVEVASVGEEGGRLDLESVLRDLDARGLRSIMVEGGGRLAASLLAGELVRRQYLIYAPIVLGPEGVPSIGAGVESKSSDWSVVRREGLGGDSLLELEDRLAREALLEAA
jgi:diaminohydroxyphosphoribosylaminopyrimidine deaminase/5-amino-6-(5-phosphoribosylamino)uracil reductase